MIGRYHGVERRAISSPRNGTYGDVENTEALLASMSGFGAIYAFSRRPLSRASRSFIGPILRGSKGVDSGRSLVCLGHYSWRLHRVPESLMIISFVSARTRATNGSSSAP
jgi:hypothetical protein